MLEMPFEWIGANLAHVRSKYLRNVRKMRFRQKSVRVNGLIRLYVKLYGYKLCPPPSPLSKGIGNEGEGVLKAFSAGGKLHFEILFFGVGVGGARGFKK